MSKYQLSIVVTMHNEGEDVVKELLNSIALQQNVDFKQIEVVIIDDGSDKDKLLSDEFINSYSYDIHYFKEQHMGVSAARQFGCDHCKGEYVQFCDCDDMFYNMCGLWIVFREIANGGFDSLVSAFVEETRMPQTKEVMYVNHDMDSTFVHGKIHKKQYLIDQKIKWNRNLTIHEDSYFNILCQNCSKNVKYCQTPFYLWKWRDNSVCRHDDKYILKTYNNILDSNDALISEFVRRGMSDKAMFYVCFMIFDAYYNMNKPEWVNQDNIEYRNNVEKHFKDYYNKHKAQWNLVPIQEKMQISNGVRNRVVNEGMLMESITIDDWLIKIDSL